MKINIWFFMFFLVSAIVLDTVFWFIGASGYWIVLWTAFGICGMGISLLGIMEIENDEYYNDSM